MIKYFLIILFCLQKMELIEQKDWNFIDISEYQYQLSSFCQKTRGIYEKLFKDKTKIFNLQKLDDIKDIDFFLDQNSDYYLNSHKISFKKDEKYFFPYFFCQDYWIIKSEELPKKFWQDNSCMKFKRKNISKIISKGQKVEIFNLEDDPKEYLKVTDIQDFKLPNKIKDEYKYVRDYGFRDIYKGFLCLEEYEIPELNFKIKNELFIRVEYNYYFDVTNKGLLALDSIIKKSCEEKNYQNTLLDKIFYCLSVFDYEYLNILGSNKVVFDPDFKMYAVPFFGPYQIESNKIKNFIKIMKKFSKICVGDSYLDNKLRYYEEIITKYLKKLFEDIQLDNPNQFKEWKDLKNIFMYTFDNKKIKSDRQKDFEYFFNNINLDDLSKKDDKQIFELNIDNKKFKISDNKPDVSNFSKSDEIEMIEKLFYANRNFLKVLPVFINLLFYFIF